MAMPKINPADVVVELNKTIDDDNVLETFLKVLDRVVKKNGVIRASKPKVSEDDPISGMAAYVWRLVAFNVSTNPQHHCMPICADFDLPAYGANGKWSSHEARIMAKGLAPLEKAIVNAVPKDEWHGVNRWAKAMGGF